MKRNVKGKGGCITVNNEELALKLQEVDDRSKSNMHRLKDVERKLEDNAEMLASIATLAQQQERMEEDIKEMKGDVKTLTAKPGKRWEAIVDKALLAIVAALVVYALAQLGIN